MKTPLQIHMENKSEEGKQININSVKEYALKIKVDTTELDEAIKKFKKMNKLVEKVKCPKCNAEVRDGNFCKHCGAKLKTVCDCRVLNKSYNCHNKKCVGRKLF